ncbi:membrane-associated protein, putative [Bodo saltans]|uniref:Membrane-associated protein, putative n=1 Tax=Bodo saltans TaxID=75058 RepID=A0A0S4J9V3_BODSA|nr:membrane-associated protein, putative [Bodo saltans]|eukprot:CUG86717.1 membrane-associated protein, putative [Bodo saltans]
MRSKQRINGNSKRKLILAAVSIFGVALFVLLLGSRATHEVPRTWPPEATEDSSRSVRHATPSSDRIVSPLPTAPYVDSPALEVLRAQSSTVVDDLVKCQVVNDPAASVQDLGTFSAAQNDVRYKRCFHGSSPDSPSSKFLYFGNHWGRHFNQMTSFVAALVLSRMLNRTLIVPPLVFEKKRIHIHDLYDARRIYDNPLQVGGSPFCALTEDEFNTLERQRVKPSAAKDNAGDSALVVDAACITMRGIKQHPQLPRGFTFKCVEAPFIKFKKNLTLFFDTVGHSNARLLTIPLAIYYAQALPEVVVHCPWRLMGPHPAVAKAVAMLTRSASLSDNDQSATVATIGVHLRSLEGSCQSRQQQYNSQEEAHGLEQQCTMKPSYVLSIAASALMVRYPQLVNAKLKQLAPHARVVSVVADDGQQPDRAAALAKALPNGVRTQQAVTAASSPLKKYLDQLRKGASASDTSMGVQAPYNLAHQQFHTVPTALPILLDFWTLANVTVFVGNQVSTLSMNVCRYRRAVGMACDNFV